MSGDERPAGPAGEPAAEMSGTATERAGEGAQENERGDGQAVIPPADGPGASTAPAPIQEKRLQALRPETDGHGGAGGEGAEGAGGADGKVSPQSVQFRGRPPRAIRFDRRILVGAGTIGLCAIAGVTWWALGHGGGLVALKPAEQAVGAARPPDILAGLPETYGAVPQLGPPLPGDLGRPILRKQEAMRANPEPSREEAEAKRRAQAARDKAQATLDAARTSGLMVGSGRATGSGPDIAPVDLTARRDDNVAGPQGQAPKQEEGDPVSSAVRGDAAAKDRFLQEGRAEPVLNAHGVEPAASATFLAAGSIITASLLTGIDSDLPGLVTAQVTQAVHDSATGRHLLIPQGARLIGRYDNAIGYGQSRLLLVWQRLIFPDGRSMILDNMPATDGAGHAGLTDRVDGHIDRLAGGILLSSLLSLGANLSIAGESELVRAVREAAQQNVMRAGDRLTQRNLDVSPTIRIRPGTPVKLLVHRDLILPLWNAKE